MRKWEDVRRRKIKKNGSKKRTKIMESKGSEYENVHE